MNRNNMIMKKVNWAVFIFMITGAAVYFVALRKPALPDATTLLPEDTMFYAGTKSPVKIAAALAFADLDGVLQKDAGLSEEESLVVSDWLCDLRGVHVGFHSFTLVPFVLDAAVVLEGSFDRPLTELLGQGLQQRIVVDEPYRDIAVNKMRISVGTKFSFELYIADPVEDYLFVAFSRRTLQDLVDRMLDGGPSLADNPQFSEMASLKGIRSADTLQYVDTQAYLNLIRDWTKTIPYPPVQPLVDLIWSELRLADYQQSLAGFNFAQQEGHSFLKITPENPIYKQLPFNAALSLPHVPADSTQFSFYRIADPVEALRQAIEMTVRLEQGISRVIGGAPTQSVRTWMEQISAAADTHPSEFGELLTGEIGIWQWTEPGAQKPAMCLYLGIDDPDVVKGKIAAISGVEIVETDGIYQLVTTTPLVWSIQPDAILISNDRNYLQASLSAEEPSLIDSAEFSKLMSRLPDEFSALQYVDYKDGIPLQNTGRLHIAILPFLNLFKGLRQLSVSVATDGMLQSHIAQDYNPDRRLLKAAVKMLFSAESSKERLGDASLPLTSEEASTQYLLGQAFYYGRGVLQDYEKATMWYRKAAEQGYADAQNSLGICYAKGRGVPHNESKAVYWYRKAAEQGHADAQNNMGYRYSTGRGVAEDETEAVRWYMKSVAQGHSWAQNNLGLHYERGTGGVSQDYEVAATLFRESAEQGFSLGQYNLGRCYEYGRGVAQDDVEAFRWYRKSAVQGNGSGQYALGRCYENGRGVDNDLYEALSWYRKSADKKNKRAQFKMGYLFHKGIGVEQDFEKAVRWYRLAAEQDHATAWENLGLLYGEGKGVPLDYDQELGCYKKAMRLEPENAHIMNSYSWFLATCKDESFRGYPKAVELAERSVELDEQFYSLDTLAVAYDRNGQPGKALETQKRLIAFRQKRNPGKEVPEWLLKRLAKFEEKAAEQ